MDGNGESPELCQSPDRSGTDCRGTFGPVLFLPYTLPKPEDASTALQLLSLEGWIGCGNESDSHARLLIPSQVIWPSPQYRLQVPVTDVQIEAIEEARKESQVNLTVWLGGLALGDQLLVPVQSSSSGSLGIKREDQKRIEAQRQPSLFDEPTNDNTSPTSDKS